MIKYLSIYKLRLSLPNLNRKNFFEGLDFSQTGVDQQDPKTIYLGMFFIPLNHFRFMFDSSLSCYKQQEKKRKKNRNIYKANHFICETFVEQNFETPSHLY